MHILPSLFPSAEQRVQITALWGMTPSQYVGETVFYDDLFRRMADPVAARFVWEQLKETECMVLWQCLGNHARNGYLREMVLARSHLSRQDFDSSVAFLTQMLLLAASSSTESDAESLHAYEESAATLYTTGRELFFAGATRTDLRLDKLLPNLGKSELLSLIHRYHLDQTALSSTTDLRKALAHALTRLDIVTAALVQQEPLVQRVIPWLYEQGGCVALPSVTTTFNLNSDALFALLRHLEDAGLAFDTLCPGQPNRLLFVPQGLRAHLAKKDSGGERSEKTEGLVPLDTPPIYSEEGFPWVPFDLLIAINAVYQQRVEITRSFHITDWCAQRIELHLLQGRNHRKDTENTNLSYLDLVFRTAEHLRLVKRQDPPWAMSIKTFYGPGPDITAWGTRTLVDQTRELLSEWRAGKIWQDLFGSAFHQWNWSCWQPEIGRSFLLSQLQACRPGRWYSIDALLTALWEQDAYALRPNLRERSDERYKTEVLREKWWCAEGEFLRGLLSSTLWEFGIVSLGYEHDPSTCSTTRASAFQITEIGADALREQHSEEMPSSRSMAPPLIVQSNFEVLLLRYEQHVLFRLLPWAEHLQIQQACRLTFSEHSVQQAILHGQALEPFLQVLVEYSGKTLPQAVEYCLREWARRYQEVQIAQGIILTVSKEGAGAQLVRNPVFRGFGLIQIAPHVLMAPIHVNITELRKHLEKAQIAVQIVDSVHPPPEEKHE